MRHSNFLSKLLLVLIMFSLILHPQATVFAIPSSSQTEAAQKEITELLVQNDLLFSYNDILSLLTAVENGELEKRGNPDELERLSHLLVFLAREGILPNELDDESDLEEDIRELLDSGSNPYEYAYDFYREGECQFAPAVCYSAADIVLCKNWFKKTAKQVGKFVKKHKKAVIIGSVVVIAAVAVVVVVGVVAATGTAAGIAVDAATAGAAAGASSAAVSSGSHREEKNSTSGESSDSSFNENVTTSSPAISSFQEDVRAFKGSLVEEQFFQSNNSGLSMEENGRIVGQVFAHQSLNSITPYEYSSPFSYERSQESKVFGDLLADRHEMVDRAFSLDNIQPISTMDLGSDFKESVYQLRGERAFELKHYDQAIFDFGKAIELNPHNHVAYLDRATIYLEIGDYDNCLADYQQYIEQKPTFQQGSLSFAVAFTKALPRGVKDSGCQLGSFVSDVARHPINTATEVIQAFGTLSKLVYSQEWVTIAETLAPEVYELVTKWETLSSKEQGDLAGYAFGKYGSDILIPGASVKLLSKGVKGAKELAVACNALKTAEKTLVLESLAQATSNSQGFVEVIPRLSAMECVVISSEEVSVLSKVEGVLSEQVRLESIEKYKYVKDFLKPHQNKYLPEDQIRELLHQTGIQTFPRPKGIPENYIAQFSDKPGGMKYVHPTDTGTFIRIMPGKPHSPFPYQQNPYVVYQKHGATIDKFGNVVGRKAAEAHIPLEEFIYRGD